MEHFDHLQKRLEDAGEKVSSFTNVKKGIGSNNRHQILKETEQIISEYKSRQRALIDLMDTQLICLIPKESATEEDK